MEHAYLIWFEGWLMGMAAAVRLIELISSSINCSSIPHTPATSSQRLRTLACLTFRKPSELTGSH